VPILEVDFDPVDVITVGVEGPPGQRSFFLEARQGISTCTLLLEKLQLQELGSQILSILEPVEGEQGPAPDPIGDSTGLPGWRVGSIQLSLDEHDGQCTLLLEERPAVILQGDEEEEEVDEEGDEEGGADPEIEDSSLRAARLVASPGQIRRLGESSLLVVAGGRPICPLCHMPIDPGGHVCPASNGHHRI
jgi:uncharacterized repeat protein (TIGR03847 family)